MGEGWARGGISMAFVKDPGRGSDVNKTREGRVRANLLTDKIYVCKLWGMELLELNLERLYM